MLRWKRILLGVTGGIAAYKAADLTSKLVKLGAEVHVGLTANATQFVAPLTFQALSGNSVITDTFALSTDNRMPHIDLARRVDCVVIAPCTANMIAKLAHGLADDWISTTILATRAPVLICPAMNQAMFDNAIVQENLGKLARRGFLIAPTGFGDLACGEVGRGRLIEVEQIIELIKGAVTDKVLAGLKFLVTAGPTREFIDPVRFISNPSSGKMGYAVARVAAHRGAQVVLVSGPSRLAPPPGVLTVPVTTAEEMLETCLRHFPSQDVVVKAAAVGDYRPVNPSRQKMKKSEDGETIELAPTGDILKTLGRLKTRQILVGFAAETENLIQFARDKLEKKNLDLIVANDVSQAGAGFEVDTNIVKIIGRHAPVQELPLLPKEDVAGIVLDRVLELVRRREGT